MTIPLLIRPEAEQDLLDAREWYEGQQKGLGDDFLIVVDGVFDRIRETPELYAIEYKSVRQFRLGRFPFVV